MSEALVRAALAEVPDPEIPVVSIVDLGMVEHVRVGPDAIEVELLPTFVGCPALDLIRSAVVERLASFGRPVRVEFGFRVPWTSDRITAKGRERLRLFGFAPPQLATDGEAASPLVQLVDRPAPCPHCGSNRTVLENAFGPSQCRSIHYCSACRQPFEAIKTI